MGTSNEHNANEPAAANTAEMLQRILDVVQKDDRKRWAEINCAIVLALATTASAWSAYEATLWSGVQTFRLEASNRAGRESTQQALAGLQLHAFDAQLVLAYFESKSRGDEKLAALQLERFRPEAKAALIAWLKTDPFNNPNAVKRPLELAEYTQPEMKEAKRLDDESGRLLNEARNASETSDRYVLFTVLFACVLFFGGIGGTLQSRRLRTVVFVQAIVLFLALAIALANMPICHE